MATWLELQAVLERLLDCERLGNEILRANMKVGPGGAATRQVYVHRSAIPANDGSGDMEYIAIDAPVGAVGEVDLLSATAIIGQYNPCVLAYLQGGDVGYLCAGTRISADIIDASDPSALLLQVHFVAFSSYQLSVELGNPTGTNAERAAGARRSAWQALGRLVTDDPELTAEREWPDGKAFVFSLQDAGGRRYEFFMALDDRGGDDTCVVIEYSLGALQGSDLRHAVEAAGADRFGVISADGFASFRVSHNLSSLSTAEFKRSIAYLVLGVQRFESARASA